jgi:hypothetical protein
MPDQADPPGLIATVRGWVVESYPYAVVRRFLELELLERSVALAAQAFIALLPIVILVVSLFVTDVGATISEQFGDRLGLDSITTAAIEALFSENVGRRTISWLAVIMILVSAFSLARRLARVYANVFELPPLKRSENWRGLVWIVLQVVMMLLASTLKQVRDDRGWLLFVAAGIALVAVWFGTDMASLRLLVPSAATRLVVASAVVSTVGRIFVGVWTAVYFARSLSDQAQQYGPIGVTFALYTYLLVAVIVYVGSPLLVTTWVTWRAERSEAALSQ